ncbi:hypothetical protein LAZ67_21002636 [Cordylochernes scorpioides]|uniref:Uncharacterized protein n=1 Tax=Cordylochernes scorpioides TaxID=51811 RepID=A0ABY6LQC3_9ARAC|nr:hypothetical protein LAZ67_21002636 [Cordylochernes scorpioides]
MEYRATPLANGLSPAELLFGRKIRTMVPCTSSSPTPKTVDQSKLRGEEEQRKMAQKTAFDRRHAATKKAELIAGEKVWVKDLRAWGSVLEKASAPRSYIVETPVGIYRRNSLILASSQQQVDPSETSPDSELPAETEETPGNELPAEELQQLPAIAPEIKQLSPSPGKVEARSRSRAPDRTKRIEVQIGPKELKFRSVHFETRGLTDPSRQISPDWCRLHLLSRHLCAAIQHVSFFCVIPITPEPTLNIVATTTASNQHATLQSSYSMNNTTVIVQHYQLIKEFDRKIETEMIRTEEYDEKALLKELESTAHYLEMYIGVLIKIDRTLKSLVEKNPEMETGLSIEPEMDTGLSIEPEMDTGLSIEPEMDTGLSIEPEMDTGLSIEPEMETGLSIEPEMDTGLSIEPETETGTSTEPETVSGETEESHRAEVKKKSVEADESEKAKVEKKSIEVDESEKAQVDKRTVIETENLPSRGSKSDNFCGANGGKVLIGCVFLGNSGLQKNLS